MIQKALLIYFKVQCFKTEEFVLPVCILDQEAETDFGKQLKEFLLRRRGLLVRSEVNKGRQMVHCFGLAEAESSDQWRLVVKTLAI